MSFSISSYESSSMLQRWPEPAFKITKSISGCFFSISLSLLGSFFRSDRSTW